jgi:hypothetical protein
MSEGKNISAEAESMKDNCTGTSDRLADYLAKVS